MKFSNLITKKVHIIGINGIGMSALALYLKKNNIDVSGSDIAANKITDTLNANGIKVYIGHKEENIKNKDIIFYSSAIKVNPELSRAAKDGIPCYNRSKLLQLICKDKFTIVVSGSHGKTSTTSLLGHLLVNSGLNPIIISGGIMQNFGQNIYLTDSNYVVVEADESDGTVFKLKPNYLIYLNVDREHIDYYKSYSKLKNKIKKYIIDNAKRGSKVFLCSDDLFLKDIASRNKDIITYGSSLNSSYSYKIKKLTDLKSTFDLFKNKKKYSDSITSPMLGEHNVSNTTAALSAMDSLGIKINKSDLLSFKGTLRRMNVIGKINKNLFIDDYAHHPTELKKLIEVLKLYKNKKKYLIVEPHRYSRLNDLYENYIETFKDIKNLIVLKTYSAGENILKGMKNSKDLVNDLNVKFDNQTVYIDSYIELFQFLDNQLNNHSDNLVITAGAE
jgi:UDP-N-acetylmuramate--alanine ligase